MNDQERYWDEFVYFMTPERPDEPVIRAELAQLPISRVKAGDATVLEAQGYKRGDCHRNCIAAAAKDPMVEHVFGWTVGEHLYLSHSVLRHADGSLHCITPGHTDTLDADGCFEFIEDKQFSYDGQWMYRRGKLGHPSLKVVRRDVELVRSHYTGLHERIKAGELTFEEAQKLGY